MSYKFRGQKVIINGEEQIIIPGVLPSNPTNGMVAIDIADNLFKVYNETKGKWIPLDDFFETPKGCLDTYTFFELGSATNEWLEYGGSSIKSDGVPAILPFDCKLISCTFSNENQSVETDIEVYSSPEGDGDDSIGVATFEVRNSRVARFSDFTPIEFSAGDKIGVFLRDQGTNVDTPVVKLYFLITNFNKENSSETYNSDFSIIIGGITVTLGL